MLGCYQDEDPPGTRTLPFRVDVTLAPASEVLGADYLHEAKVTLCRAAGDSSELDCLGWGLDLPPCDLQQAWDGPVPLSSLVSLGRVRKSL